MKLTKKDFENVVNGRVEDELNKGKVQRPIICMWFFSFVASLLILYWVSKPGGILLFGAAFIAGLYWARRNAKRVAARIRLELSRQWEGYIEQ